jgi:uncharacterized membrane protein (UPF0136 family)
VTYDLVGVIALAGLTFGGLLVGSGVLITKRESYQGHTMASVAADVMTLAMGNRFLSSGKFMPAGMVTTLGAVGLAYNIQKAIVCMPEKEGRSRTFMSFSIQAIHHITMITASPWIPNFLHCVAIS